MTTAIDLAHTIEAFSPTGLTLAELLAHHPDVARRTAQRWISEWLAQGRLLAQGEGRARRYRSDTATASHEAPQQDPLIGILPLSADSRDILAYIDQPMQARKPVGYQREFLDSYQANTTWYLSETLRRQLHKMG